MPKIRPCPFCGRKCSIEQKPNHTGDWFQIVCSCCLASSGAFPKNAIELAIKDWNTRVGDK